MDMSLPWFSSSLLLQVNIFLKVLLNVLDMVPDLGLGLLDEDSLLLDILF